MDRDVVRAHVKAVLVEKFGGSAPAVEARPQTARPSEAKPARDLVVVDDVYRAKREGTSIRVGVDAILTPLAAETATRLGVVVERGAPAAPAAAATSVAAAPPAVAPGAESAGRRLGAGFVRLAVASDHGGFRMKEILKAYVSETLGASVVDLGTHDEKAVDYPDLAHAAAAAVSRGEVDAAIVVDGAGIGSAMAANRRKGVRAATCLTILQALNAREHNDANVLCLGGRHLGEDAAKAVLTTFLNTPFAGGRHQARVLKIDAGAP